MSQLETLIGNMRHAVRNRESATIGGGIFTPQEMNEILKELEKPTPVQESEVLDMIGMIETGQAEEGDVLYFLQRLASENRPVVLAAPALEAPAAEVESIGVIVGDLLQTHARTTKGEWQQGNTTHDTVVKSGDGDYKVASFRHACDAQFVDVAHKYLPQVLSHMASLESEVQRLKSATPQAPAGVQADPVAWMYQRHGWSGGALFKPAGQEADDLRIGRPNIMAPCPNHYGWTALYAAPQAPAAPSVYSDDMLAALHQWRQRCEVMGAPHLLPDSHLLDLEEAGLLRKVRGGHVMTTAGRVALAAPATPSAWDGPVRELLGHLSDVLDDESFAKIDTARWNAVSALVGAGEAATPAAPSYRQILRVDTTVDLEDNPVEGMDHIMSIYERSMGKDAPDDEMAEVVELTKEHLLTWWAAHREKIRAAMVAAETKTFEEVWAEFTAAGFSYGGGALENVRFGWEIARGMRPEKGK